MTSPASTGQQSPESLRTAQPVLVLDRVVYVYRLSARLAALWGKPTRVVALDGVSLAVGRGEVVGITGPSGGGKSTLAAIAAGERRPTRGTVRRPAAVAYLPQDPDAAADPKETVARFLGDARDATSFLDAGLPDVDRFLERPLGTLSGGERQRLALGRALARRPDLLIADEPLSLVDLPTRRTILSRLRRRLEATGTAGLYVTHDLPALAALGARIVTLAEGRIVDGVGAAPAGAAPTTVR